MREARRGPLQPQPPDAGSHAFRTRHEPRVTERSPMGRSFLYVTPAASAPPRPGGSPSVKTFLMRSAPAGCARQPNCAAPAGRSQPPAGALTPLTAHAIRAAPSAQPPIREHMPRPDSRKPARASSRPSSMMS
jgi:hypothetical protein